MIQRYYLNEDSKLWLAKESDKDSELNQVIGVLNEAIVSTKKIKQWKESLSFDEKKNLILASLTKQVQPDTKGNERNDTFKHLVSKAKEILINEVCEIC